MISFGKRSLEFCIQDKLAVAMMKMQLMGQHFRIYRIAHEHHIMVMSARLCKAILRMKDYKRAYFFVTKKDPTQLSIIMQDETSCMETVVHGFNASESAKAAQRKKIRKNHCFTMDAAKFKSGVQKIYDVTALLKVYMRNPNKLEMSEKWWGPDERHLILEAASTTGNTEIPRTVFIPAKPSSTTKSAPTSGLPPGKGMLSKQAFPGGSGKKQTACDDVDPMELMQKLKELQKAGYPGYDTGSYVLQYIDIFIKTSVASERVDVWILSKAGCLVLVYEIGIGTVTFVLVGIGDHDNK